MGPNLVVIFALVLAASVGVLSHPKVYIVNAMFGGEAAAGAHVYLQRYVGGEAVGRQLMLSAAKRIVILIPRRHAYLTNYVEGIWGNNYKRTEFVIYVPGGQHVETMHFRLWPGGVNTSFDGNNWFQYEQWWPVQPPNN